MVDKAKKLIRKDKYVDAETGEEVTGKTFTNSIVTLDGTQRYFTLGEEDQKKFINKLKSFLDLRDIV